MNRYMISWQGIKRGKTNIISRLENSTAGDILALVIVIIIIAMIYFLTIIHYL